MRSSIVKEIKIYSILLELITCYRDKADLIKNQLTNPKDSAPIINSRRFTIFMETQIDEDIK